MSRNVDRYSPENPVMTGETLLDLAQGHKLAELKRSFGHDIGTHDKIKVTEEDIENMGDALKSIVFYIPVNAYREAMLLARERGVLTATSQWLKT
jgi:hypothetical protein